MGLPALSRLLPSSFCTHTRRALLHLSQRIQSIVNLRGKQELFSSGSATVLKSYVSNFELMPQKTHSLAQGPSHPAAPSQERIDPRVFLTPWPAFSSSSSSPSLTESGLSPCCRFPLFVAQFGFFLRLLLRASPDGVAWRRVASVEQASRQTTCCRLGNKTFGCCVYTANHPALPTNKAGGSRKEIETLTFLTDEKLPNLRIIP